jgi:hypothetical protein
MRRKNLYKKLDMLTCAAAEFEKGKGQSILVNELPLTERGVTDRLDR